MAESYIIKASTEEIRAVTDKLEAEKNKMESIMNDMHSKVNDLQNYYKSNAGTEFITKYEKVSKDITGCLENLQNLLTGLKNAAGIFEPATSKDDADVNKLSDSAVFINK